MALHDRVDARERLGKRREQALAVRSSAKGAGIFSALIASISACGDPVPDAAIAALGPEDPTVPPGPMHRPGQPCLLCHHDGGDAPAFTLAGTVYTDAKSLKPVGSVAVIVLDSANTSFTASTNCAGNFYVRADEYVPRYPIWLSLRAGMVKRDMAAPAYREGSCAGCHTYPRNATSPSHVYLIEDPTVEALPPGRCH